MRFPNDYFIPELRGLERPSPGRSRQELVSLVNYLRKRVATRGHEGHATWPELKEIAALAVLIEYFEGNRPASHLNVQEQPVVFAALAAMVEDQHAPADQLTEEQWKVAKSLYKRFTKIMDDDVESVEVRS